jgi:flavodoxin
VRTKFFTSVFLFVIEYHERQAIDYKGFWKVEMKIAIIYASTHHGNTKKVVDAIVGAWQTDADLLTDSNIELDVVDATQVKEKYLADYDLIGFASGIYYSKFHQAVLNFAAINLPEDKQVFYLCTCGGRAAYSSIDTIAKRKHAKVVGKFSCKGYDTFGPFKLFGGLAKGHPDEADLRRAVRFFKGLYS